jgi:hypothetical protein
LSAQPESWRTQRRSIHTGRRCISFLRSQRGHPPLLLHRPRWFIFQTMSKSQSKPETPLAKADAKLTADHRKVYPQWDDDVARYGLRVADYNAGFIGGVKNEVKREKKRKKKSK